jgi:hypothetical protein
MNDPAFRFDLPVKLTIDPVTGAAGFHFGTEGGGDGKAPLIADRGCTQTALVEPYVLQATLDVTTGPSTREYKMAVARMHTSRRRATTMHAPSAATVGLLRLANTGLHR